MPQSYREILLAPNRRHLLQHRRELTKMIIAHSVTKIEGVVQTAQCTSNTSAPGSKEMLLNI
jgi:hypothetical protein